MKKLFIFWLVTVLCLSCIMLQGCEDSSNTPMKASDLSIEDFKWETVPSKHNGTDCYLFSLTNNSKYDIIAVEFTYKVKDDVSEEQLVVYSEFMKDHDGYIEETDSPKGIVLKGNKNVLVSKGDTLTGLHLTIGYEDWSWYDYPTKEQFELMEPKELQIGVVGNDNKLYIAYYNFESTTWILDEETFPIDTWSDKEIAKKITKPDEGHHIVTNDDEDEFSIHSYGVSVDDYNSYVESIENLGFARDDTYSGHFEGKSDDGYIIELWYDEDDERLSIYIKKE